MARPVYVLNGSNFNRLGRREPKIYGHTTLEDIEAICRAAAGETLLKFRQKNSEAEMIGCIHEATDDGAALLINPAAFTFTSMTIMDALKMFAGPLIKLHISNIHRREPMYHDSLVATAVIAGLGARGYGLAITALLQMISEDAGDA